MHVAGTLAGRRGSALALVVSAYAAGTILIAPVAAALLDATTLLKTFAVLAATLGVAVLAAAALLPAAAPPPRAAGKGPHTAGARRRTPPIRGSVARESVFLARAAAQAGGFYARWLPTLVTGQGQRPRAYGEFGPLAAHLRYVERASRKLARATFYGDGTVAGAA